MNKTVSLTGRGRHVAAGFTLIELLVVMAIIALLLSLAAPRYFGGVDKARETVLRENLHQMRDALDKYYGDNARYPDALDDLVAKKYLRSMAKDAGPMTLAAPSPLEPANLGLAYAFNVGGGVKSLIGTVGYRSQVIVTDMTGSLSPFKGRDTTEGLTVGVVAAF